MSNAQDPYSWGDATFESGIKISSQGGVGTSHAKCLHYDLSGKIVPPTQIPWEVWGETPDASVLLQIRGRHRRNQHTVPLRGGTNAHGLQEMLLLQKIASCAGNISCYGGMIAEP